MFFADDTMFIDYLREEDWHKRERKGTQNSHQISYNVWAVNKTIKNRGRWN
jgi:hypothetical protein